MNYQKADNILNALVKQSSSNIQWIAIESGYKSSSEIKAELQYLSSAGYITLDEILGTEIKITQAGVQFITNGGFSQLYYDKELDRQNKKISIELSSKQIKEIKFSKKYSIIALCVSILSFIVTLVVSFLFR
jgi:hypothetical protein